jgi:HD-GYP domain-containing protein (c-di-GMP phosphodiesterase class II)/DNA-binding CsgD family transcriptional regulator
MATGQPEAQTIRLAELLAAFSLATDLAMSFPPETALRTCLLAMHIGRDLRLSEDQLSEVFYVSLLRHIGCTAFSHEEGMVVGDDNSFRGNFTGIDDRRTSEVAMTALRTLGAGQGLVGRMKVFSAFAREFGQQPQRRILTAHCDASRQLARQLGMTAGVVLALDHVFERWDGKGHLGLRADAISLSASVTHFSHSVVLEQWRSGDAGTRAMVRRRANGEFDPSLTEIFLRRPHELLELVAAESVWDTVLDAEPASRPWLPASRIGHITEAIALFSDMKSAYMLGHSQAVAGLVEAAATAMKLPEAEVFLLRRAALLHNLGRLAVSSGIWCKPAALNPGEWERVRLYPYHTERIVTRSAALRPIASLSGSVQERLDGSGYHRGLPGAMLPTPARVLAAADVYQALREERPQRRELAANAAARELVAESRAGRLDGEAVDAVLQCAGHPKPHAYRSWPAGLTDREVEVLRRVAQAKPNKTIANELVISEETVRNHVRHIYEKIGVSSRAGAALFAMEKDLIRH